MKTFINVIFGLVFSLAVNQSYAATVDLIVNDANILVGEEFTIDVKVSGVSDLIAFGFDENHDASWNPTGVSVAPPFNDDSALFPSTDVAGSFFSLFPPFGLSGDNILLASLSYIANTAGTFSFGITSDLTMLSQGLFEQFVFPQSDLTTSFDVTINEASVPEPPVVILMLVGLLGLMRATKSRIRSRD